MITKKIECVLKKQLSFKKLNVTGNINHINILAVSDVFSNISTLKRQQMIYLPLMNYISNKIIHAVSINAYSISEWNNIVKS